MWYWKLLKFGLGRFSIIIRKNPGKKYFLTIKAVNKDIKAKRKFYRQ